MLDIETFARLCADNRGRLLAVVGRMVGADAEDVVQDAFEAAWKHRDSFRGQSAPSTWLYRVAVNCALMRLRSARRSRLELVEELPPRASPLPSPQESAEAHQIGRDTERVVGALPAVDQRILTMRLIEERSSDEVAHELGLSTAAVKTRLHRARHRVAEALTA